MDLYYTKLAEKGGINVLYSNYAVVKKSVIEEFD